MGRVRNRDLVCFEPASPWIPCKSLYARASATPKTVGVCDLVRSQSFRCRLVLGKAPRKHRSHPSVWGQKVRSWHSRKQAASNREPWLLATSRALADCPAKQIVAFYRTGMQIEEVFRDMKPERYGFGLNGSPPPPSRRSGRFCCSLQRWRIWRCGSSASRQFRPDTTIRTSPYHTAPLGALGHHAGPPRHPPGARPVVRVSPVGRVASQPCNPVRPHDNMKFVGSPQGQSAISERSTLSEIRTDPPVARRLMRSNVSLTVDCRPS